MGGRERVASGDPRNSAVLAGLARLERLPGYVASAAPASVDPYQLGAHPDLVEFLWQALDASLPTRCAWIVHGRPALVRRSSGVLFAFALGTHSVWLRVPDERQAELGLGPGAAASTPAAPAAPFEGLDREWVLASFGGRASALVLEAFEGAA